MAHPVTLLDVSWHSLNADVRLRPLAAIPLKLSEIMSIYIYFALLVVFWSRWHAFWCYSFKGRSPAPPGFMRSNMQHHPKKSTMERNYLLWRALRHGHRMEMEQRACARCSKTPNRTATAWNWPAWTSPRPFTSACGTSGSAPSTGASWRSTISERLPPAHHYSPFPVNECKAIRGSHGWGLWYLVPGKKQLYRFS